MTSKEACFISSKTELSLVIKWSDDFIEEQQGLELKEAIDKLDEDDDGQQDLTLKP